MALGADHKTKLKVITEQKVLPSHKNLVIGEVVKSPEYLTIESQWFKGCDAIAQALDVGAKKARADREKDIEDFTKKNKGKTKEIEAYKKTRKKESDDKEEELFTKYKADNVKANVAAEGLLKVALKKLSDEKAKTEVVAKPKAGPLIGTHRLPQAPKKP